MSQNGNCNSRPSYRPVGSNCNSPSNLFDQKNQVDNIFKYISQKFYSLDLKGPSGGGGGSGDITVSKSVAITTHTVVPTTTQTEVNPTTNTHFDGSEDEDSTQIPIGFPVQIFGTSYTSIFVDSNSYFTFGGISQTYGRSSYNAWIAEVPYPGVFIGSNDGNYQEVKSTGAVGVAGQRTNTIRFKGAVLYSNTDPDVIWEVTFKENEPAKVYLNIIAFNDQGNSEGVDFFTFSSSGVSGQYVQFSPSAGSQYAITMSSVTQLTDFTGSKLAFLDQGVEVSENILENSVDLTLGLSNFIKSDTTISPSFNKVQNIVSLTQSDYTSLVSKDSNTLYILVN